MRVNEEKTADTTSKAPSLIDSVSCVMLLHIPFFSMGLSHQIHSSTHTLLQLLPANLKLSYQHFPMIHTYQRAGRLILALLYLIFISNLKNSMLWRRLFLHTQWSFLFILSIFGIQMHHFSDKLLGILNLSVDFILLHDFRVLG